MKEAIEERFDEMALEATDDRWAPFPEGIAG
jgi:hypothetical protein